MKLLGWMHWKSRQTDTEPLKNFKTGNSCSCHSENSVLQERQCYPESYCSAHLRQSKTCQNSSIELKAKTFEEVSGKESSTVIHQPFHGFLAIGTLGSPPINTEPTTPKFSITLENITQKQSEVTENELKLLNSELEKFLEAEANEEGDESSERTSNASTITLSGKQFEGVEDEYMVACPLQGYLFGSSIELAETGQKLSLGELFKKNDIANQQKTGQSERGENEEKKTYVIPFMKKMLKNLYLPSSCIASVTADSADSVSTKRKLPKVLRMFHKKVHPEKSKGEKISNMSQKYKIKHSFHDGYDNHDVTFREMDKKRLPQAAILKKDISTLSLSYNKLYNTHLNGRAEHWIKTDADYLVLEL